MVATLPDLPRVTAYWFIWAAVSAWWTGRVGRWSDCRWGVIGSVGLGGFGT